MTYKECLDELEIIGLKEDFIKEYEPLVDDSFLIKLKEMTTISSAANLIRQLLSKLKEYTNEYKKWHSVFIYLITPEFARKNI